MVSSPCLTVMQETRRLISASKISIKSCFKERRLLKEATLVKPLKRVSICYIYYDRVVTHSLIIYLSSVNVLSKFNLINISITYSL